MNFAAARTRLAVAAFLVAIALLGAVRTMESYLVRKQAQKMVQILSQIKVGVTPEKTARTLLSSFARYKDTDENQNSRSYNSFTFVNGFLRFHHLTEGTIVWTSVDYKNGIVTGKSIECAHAPRLMGSVSESLTPIHHAPAHPPDGEPGREIGIGGGLTSGYFVIKVRDDTTVSAARRQLDWQIDLSCMTALHGCNDPRKVLAGALLQSPTR